MADIKERLAILEEQHRQCPINEIVRAVSDIRKHIYMFIGGFGGVSLLLAVIRIYDMIKLQ